MKLALTPIQGRLLAVLLALTALALLVAAVALPTLWLHKRYDSFIEDYGDRLQRYRRVAALRPAIEEAIKGTEKRDSRKYYLKGGSPTLAAAELQGLVTRIVDENQGKIISSQILPAKEDAKATGPLKVAISMQMGAAIIPLQMILHTLETAEPYLFIDQLTVRANQGRGYKPLPGVQPEYVVQLTVHAYAPAAGAKP
jgi:general secretion pathway protein M